MRKRLTISRTTVRQWVGEMRDTEVRKLASAIDERVRQLLASAPGIGDRDLIEQMLAYLPSLNQIWTTASDDTLAILCSEFPGFHRYAQVMEDAFEEQRRNPVANPVASGIEPLPDRVNAAVTRLMGEAATLERELQNLVHAAQRLVTLGHLNQTALQAETARARGVEALHAKWVAGLAGLAKEIEGANVAPASAQVLARAFREINERIGNLNERFLVLALAGQAEANSGPGDAVH